MQLENYIMDNFVKKIEREIDGKRTVFEQELAKFGLTYSEKEMILSLLRKYHINYCKDVIKEEDRSTKVRDYDYGEVFDKSIDVPKIAEIEYEDEQMVYENFDELEKFLEAEFIPKYAQIKKNIYNKIQKKQPYLSVRLKDILSLKLSETEEAYVLEYLEEKGIYVNGYSQSLAGEFDNYNYTRTYKNQPLPKALTSEENIKKICEYQKTKDNKLREEIIIGNMRLVRYVAYKLSLFKDIPQEELESYGYEGLMYAIEKFNSSEGNAFSSYAVPCIRGFILRGIHEIKGIREKNLYYETLKVKKAMANIGMDEDEMYKSLYSKREYSNDYEKTLAYMQVHEIPSIDEIIDKYLELEEHNDEYECLTPEERIALFNGYIPGINMSTNDETDDTTFDMTSYICLKESLVEVLSTLTERERQVLAYRFGLNDGRARTLEEVGKMFNVTRGRIRQVEVKALRHLRHPSRARKLRSYLEY